MAAHIYDLTCDCQPTGKAAFDNFQPARHAYEDRAERQFLSAIAGPLRKLKRQTWALLTGATPEKAAGRKVTPWTAFEGLLLDRAFNEYMVAELGQRQPDPEGWRTEGGLLPTQLATHFDTGAAVGVQIAQAEVASLLDLARERNKREFLNRAFARLSDRGWGCLKDVMDRPGSLDWYGQGHPGQAPGVRQIIEHGLGIGQNPVATARECSAAYDNYERWQFSRLARTETMFALNAGTQAELEAAGYSRITDVTGEYLAPPPFHPQCRCSWSINVDTKQMVYSISLLACYLCQAKRQTEALARSVGAVGPQVAGAVTPEATPWHEALRAGPITDADAERTSDWFYNHVETAGTGEEMSAEQLKALTADSLAQALAGDADWEKLAIEVDTWGDYGPMGNLIASWAATSGDSNPKAIAIQMAARDEFGLRGISTAHYEKAAVEKANELLSEHGAGLRKFLRAQYDLAQADLNAAGIDELTLWRGVKYPAEGFETVGLDHWQDAKATMAPLSSFSHDAEEAAGFGALGQDEVGNRVGTMIAAHVPADRVLSFPGVGFGCAREGEVVVLGGDASCREFATLMRGGLRDGFSGALREELSR